MPRRRIFALLVLAGLSEAAVVAWKFMSPSKLARLQDYNIILISLDTARADFFGCYGNQAVSTPHMDALASEGVLFENFYSNINATLPAHSSIMTGLYPAQHGVARNSMRLAASNFTLPEFFAAKNYKTAAFIGSFILASTFGFNQGFQTFNETFKVSPPQYAEHNITVGDGKKLNMIVHKTNVRQITRKAEEVNQAFFQWLDQNERQKFFAFIHYYDPHFPYIPPRKWYKKYFSAIPPGIPLTQPERNRVEASFQKKIDPNLIFRSSEIQQVKYNEEINALLKLYLAEIEYTDHAIGQVMNRLKKKNLRSRTILIVTADHGENLVEHWDMNEFFGHGTLTFETETHVPFVISCPGVIPSGKRVKQIASHVDIFPTLAELIGAKFPSGIKGVSLVPDLLGDRAPLHRPIYSEACQPYVNWQRDHPAIGWLNQQNSASIRWGDYKYINMPRKQYEAAFQISQDRTEEKDILRELSIKKPELLIALRDGLQDWRNKLVTGHIDLNFQLSEEDREKMKSLGYTQ
jgi:arylsulfatase A-like enzyme